MKIGLMNLKTKLMTKSYSQLCLKLGGLPDILYINASIFIVLFFFNTVTVLLRSGDITEYVLYSLPFLFLFIITIFTKSKLIDLIINIIILSGSIILEEFGHFSSIPFIFFILAFIENRKQVFIFGTYIFILLVASSFRQEISIIRTSLFFVGYVYIFAKYFYYIHIPNIKLKQTIIDQSTTISDLKRKLSILGSPKGLSNEQILELYPFMSHTSDHPYRKIHDLILLTEGKVYKEIADINNIKNISTVSDQFAKMREAVGKATNRAILNNSALVFVCVELNILKLNYRYVENI